MIPHTALGLPSQTRSFANNIVRPRYRFSASANFNGSCSDDGEEHRHNLHQLELGLEAAQIVKILFYDTFSYLHILQTLAFFVCEHLSTSLFRSSAGSATFGAANIGQSVVVLSMLHEPNRNQFCTIFYVRLLSFMLADAEDRFGEQNFIP